MNLITVMQTRNTNGKLQFNQYHFDNDTEVIGLINKLIRVCSSTEKTKNIYADLNLIELMIRLLQSQYLQQVSTETETSSNQSRLHYIHENISEKILVNTLCRKAYLSRNAFFRLFKEQFGVTPLDYINHQRIKLAKQLLASSNQSITQTGLQCGFTDVNYFVCLFRKMEGITPGSYHKCLQSEQLS